jgi:3-hydroxyisobutyrate dehydrogenase-like beta-hydroxyacid dehydrogenase
VKGSTGVQGATGLNGATGAKNSNVNLGKVFKVGRTPVTALVDQLYAHIQARGGKRWDTSSLMHLLMKD